ncbi:GAF domain-containing protein [Plantactinospora solaniradicis]|uniref:GAF domain-containing protein n=1 Tax=Plantactinospora solaniradicis TaxID=1723736 RepID=A0ABW1K456_9ACTN
MGNAWLAEVGTDPLTRAREIGRAHSAFVSTHALSGVDAVRPVVAQSWLRSADARVEQAGDAPVTLVDEDLSGYRSRHPLASVIGLLRQLVGTVAEEGEHLMAVSDADGRLMWVEGHPVARARAERMNFVEGALWDEEHAGTNAPGTALALDHEVQIFATEHFRPAVQAWTCSAAPIHDPATGRPLGVVDITGDDGVANPLSLALVRAAARAAESELARRPSGLWLPGAGPPRLSALGRDEGLLRLDGRDVRLHRRHTEIMVLLMLSPDGMTGDQLASALYDGPANSTTLRVELTRLRRLIGDRLASRPYRLVGAGGADFLDVVSALRADDLRRALGGYHGPLLPNSEAPGVVEQRNWLHTRLCAAVLACTDPDLVRGWADRHGFDDLRVWEWLERIAAYPSTHRTIAEERCRQLRTEYGLPHRRNIHATSPKLT